MVVRIGMAQAGQSLTQHVRQFGDAARQVVAAAVEGATIGARDELRQQLGSRFRGNRTPTLVTAKFYPPRDDKPPVGWIFPRDATANRILTGHRGALIEPKKPGTTLAIPTRHVPLVRGRRPMTPDEVQRHFGEKLDLVPRPRGSTGRAWGMLVLRQQTVGRSGKVRRATPGRRRQGRGPKMIVMFFLVPAVRLPARYKPEAVMQNWQALLPSLADRAARAMGLGR
ncbi:DUF6441 family protein [Falsiroseomonas selenitidurans]|uniref:Uncharacterized protein n=1 Tax=Falsiroseomonas selenitidurans TaxID=2716335 RepID=A0ABX1E8F6_9PROT|nr:DUF6441 family protein [Falsiroseomonas selenitidurans]NKC33500.1 hypothetical protein [Falsiroseomonas selenitidurans]